MNTNPAGEMCWPRTNQFSSRRPQVPLGIPSLWRTTSSPISPQSPLCPAAPRGWAGSRTTVKETCPRIVAGHTLHPDPPRSGDDHHLGKQGQSQNDNQCVLLFKYNAITFISNKLHDVQYLMHHKTVKCCSITSSHGSSRTESVCSCPTSSLSSGGCGDLALVKEMKQTYCFTVNIYTYI